jgi:hypothetical protein
MRQCLIMCCSLTGIATDEYMHVPCELMMSAEDDAEQFRRLELKYVRGCIRFLERAIELHEKAELEAIIADMPNVAREEQRQADECRVELQRHRMKERKLLEQQPGGITAPPPREKQ